METGKPTFKWLLEPHDLQDFIQNYWGQSYFRHSRSDYSYFGDLFSERDLEFAIYSASKVPDGIEMMQEENRPQSCASQAQAVSAFRNGYSLRIPGIQRFLHPIMSLCRNLEQVVSSPVNVNMYLTPGAGKKALRRHYDTHDVFVLQVHGNKQWRLFAPDFPAPLEYVPALRNESKVKMSKFRLPRDVDGSNMVSLTDEFTLEQGDCLYLPRGVWHEAESLPGEVSCHLTVGFQPTTYLDLLSAAMSRVALTEPLLCKSLPIGFAVDPNVSELVSSQFQKIAQGLPMKIDPIAALGDLTSHFLRSNAIGFENSLLRRLGGTDVGELGASTVIHMADGAVCGINAATTPKQLVCGPFAYAISPEYENASYFIANNRSFTLADLPGDIQISDKIKFVRPLLEDGLLHIATEMSMSKRNITEKDDASWLPVQLNIKTKTIHWLDFGTRKLSEPFLQQSVRGLRNENPIARSRITKLQETPRLLEGIPLSGFIFHISRCGSTLLSNCLNALGGVVVISEPQPISSLIVSLYNRTCLELEVDETLKKLVRAYSQQRSETDRSLVIKLSSLNILQIARFRIVLGSTL